MRLSVVIPTIGRPELSRAVDSVLAQTVPVHEIIVAADTTDELGLPADDRVRIIRVGPGAGGNAGRQSGVEQATGDVIGLLDDDDEWSPTKVSVLSELVADATGPWLATSRTRMKRADGTELIQPSFPIAAGEDVRTYMFAKRTPRSGHGFIQASTLLFPRTLALEVPFDVDLKFHQDVSWLTSVAARHPDLRVFQAWEPLASYYATEGSVSKRIAPQGSIAWARRFLSDDRRLLGDFVLTQSLGFARRTGSPAAMIRTLWAGVRLGRPGAAAVLYAVGATVKYSLRRKNT
ncbi:glycosyltransferase family 2 protein [Microbacterium sp. NPDC089188]|uniref:glycosyltransferase family 2 protein n=1 Tax=Microbacterium sp. NPDC089188 TaxID=3154971 RepID=UPI0034352A83